MPGDDVVIRINVRVTETGEQAEAEVLARSPETVTVRIDPSTPWDREALRELSMALDIVAKTLPFNCSQQ